MPPQEKVRPASVPGTLNTTVCADRVTVTAVDEGIEPASTFTLIVNWPLPAGKNELDWSVVPVYLSPPIATSTDALICAPPALATS